VKRFQLFNDNHGSTCLVKILHQSSQSHSLRPLHLNFVDATNWTRTFTVVQCNEVIFLQLQVM